jgi:hypothetical protein
VTFTIPSIASKTIGTGSFLFMGFYLQGGSSQTPVHGLPTITWGGTGNVDVVRMMVNEGPAADFETAGRDISDELRLCQRYYEKSYDLDVVPGTNLGAGYPMGGHGWVVSGIASDDAIIGSSRPFLVPKRSTPIVTTYSPAGLNLTGQAYFFRSVGSGGAGSFALGSSFANTTMIGVSINQTVNTGVECVICWTAEAEI